MTVYGYPREPEDSSGEETPDTYPTTPAHSSSAPVAVPFDAAYPGVAGLIPGQRPAAGDPVPAPAPSPAEYPAPGSGRHRTFGMNEAEHAAPQPAGADPSAFTWLRGPSPSSGQPVVPPDVPPAGFAPSPQFGQPAVPEPALPPYPPSTPPPGYAPVPPPPPPGYAPLPPPPAYPVSGPPAFPVSAPPVAPASAPPGFGPSPAMGQPALGQPGMGQPAMGQPPPMGQPALGQPAFGQPVEPPLGQPPMGQPPLGQPHMGQPPAGEPEPPWLAASAAVPTAPEVTSRLTDSGLPMRPVPGRATTDGLVADRTGMDRTARVGAPAATSETAPSPRPRTADLPPAVDLSAVIDAPPEIPPWDRRPLLIVLASAVVLVLLGVVSGVVAGIVYDRIGPHVSFGNLVQTPDPGASPSGEPAAAPPPADDTITLSGVGDVIMGDLALGLPPNNGAGFFDPVKAELASDLVMGNLETPLSDPTGYDKCGPPPHPECFQFSMPPYFAGVLSAGGFQLMNLANNHTNDQGATGLTNTRDALGAAGIKYTGGVDQITVVTVKGLKVAVLGFSVYSWGANLNNIPHAVELVQQAAAESDIVVVQMQAGAEGADKNHVTPGHETFFGEDRGDELAFTHAVIDAGADVVFGHGPHVMRGMEFYKGRLIAFSLGNFCGYKSLAMTGWSGVGGILKVTLHKDGSWASGKLVATEMVGAGSPAIDSDLRALGFVAGLSQQDFGASAARIDNSTGDITPPE